MLRPEINELLTQTGPGTPMGNLFRRNWIPALLAEELPANDCPPVRVKLLSERLIAFRDSDGRYGLIDEFCAHRGVSLWFGRNEESGLRCAYHGWKYDVTGQCVEIPSEPDERQSTLCRKIKLTSYPLVKLGDVLWTYMGDPERAPARPAWEFIRVPAGHAYTSKRWQECNWLQALEGGIDSSHVSWLHSSGLQSDPLFRGARGNKYNLADRKPFFEVVDSDGGLFIGVRRNAEDGKYYWRITPWVMPAFTMIPPRGDHPVHGHFWIPIDDENCWVYSYDYHAVRPLTEAELQAMRDGHGVHNEYVPGTFRPLQNKDNDYLMDREAQRRGDTYSGIKGIAMQDASLQESMGPIVDRSKEKLVSTDSGIIMARRKLWRAVEALRDEGTDPPGVNPEHHKVRSAAVVLGKDEAFADACAEELTVRPGFRHASV
ncbi:MAG: aromatic ring-hydroxylating dioxygenase subunit alpha [Actinobacteria bacterium]|nr:aromatic ring-hydroxylating dioxygenase subunit alpha [Actinomycetota bacterium]MBO0784457.1 aromatic ring-hydroxylating dioxygenase subunit alpha [Actinomycetota bacterium]